LAIAVFLLALTLWQAQGFWAILLLATAMMLLSQSISPIVDASVVSLVRHGIGQDFGRMRLWGSVSFAAASVAGGLLLGLGGPNAVFGSYVVATACVIAVSFLLPSPPGVSSVANADTGAALRLLGQQRLLVVFTSAALVLASHATFNSYGSLQLIASGYPDWSVGLLWALATSAEIAMFWAGPLVARILSPYALLLIAAGIGVVRWSLMALEPGLTFMIVLQLLHAATFSGSYLGMMRFVQRDVPDDFGARAQSAFVTMLGIMTALTTLAMGPFYHHLGGAAFQVTALLPLVALGLLLAFRASLTTVSGAPPPEAKQT
jgi:PPP family 3-phenylpropionic acid transporter